MIADMNIHSFETFAMNRKSVREYTMQAVSKETISRILTIARSAPSGGNLQPGKFVVLTGEALKNFSNKLCLAIEGGLEVSQHYSYFPEPMPRSMLRLQARSAASLFGAAGIDRNDALARSDLFMQNYRFFGAAVGIVVTIDRRMGSGCFMDLGLTLQTLFLAAQSAGLASCGIGALANYGPYIVEKLGLDNHEIVVCGIALGYEAEGAPINQAKSERMTLAEYVTFAE